MKETSFALLCEVKGARQDNKLSAATGTARILEVQSRNADLSRLTKQLEQQRTRFENLINQHTQWGTSPNTIQLMAQHPDAYDKAEAQWRSRKRECSALVKQCDQEVEQARAARDAALAKAEAAAVAEQEAAKKMRRSLARIAVSATAEGTTGGQGAAAAAQQVPAAQVSAAAAAVAGALAEGEGGGEGGGGGEYDYDGYDDHVLIGESDLSALSEEEEGEGQDESGDEDGDEAISPTRVHSRPYM